MDNTLNNTPAYLDTVADEMLALQSDIENISEELIDDIDDLTGDEVETIRATLAAEEMPAMDAIESEAMNVVLHREAA
jgi:hypothetical protein